MDEVAVLSPGRSTARETSPAVRFWIVPHTHWDREWFMPFEDFQLRLARTVDELMDVLEADPEFTCFTLDGQAVVVEDYLEARPAARARLTCLISSGRIRIGPSYVLPDEYLSGQEALIRNLLIGRAVCRQFGGSSRVAYYPDTFGHVAQMPQIVRGFGIDSFVFWRGLGEDADRLGAAFGWVAPDGSEVLALRQIDGYSALTRLGRWKSGGFKTSDPDHFAGTALARLKQLHAMATPYLERAGLIDLLAGNGDDHAVVQADLPSVVDACRFAWPEAELKIAGFDEYAAQVLPHAAGLATYSGEMCEGKEAWVTRGVNSTRMWIKQRAEAVERTLLEAEIACSLAYLYSGAEYPMEQLTRAWKELLENYPHDSIAGCSVDAVHRDMRGRFNSAENIAVRMLREGLWKAAGQECIYSHREWGRAERSAVNLLPWRRSGVVELLLPAELASARSIRAVSTDGDLPCQVVRDKYDAKVLVAAYTDGFAGTPIRLERGRQRAGGARLIGANVLENEYLRVEVNDDGTVDVTHKTSGQVVPSAGWIEDEADRGDEYNFCPTEEPSKWDSRTSRVRIRHGMNGPVVASVVVEIASRLPRELTRDRKSRVSTRVSCPMRIEVRLAAGVDRVEFVTTVENHADDHRLRVVFPMPACATVRAEGHYAVLRRPVGPFVHGADWIEPPAQTHHTLGLVEAEGVAVLTKGLPEYEARVAGMGTEVAVTLLRSVGWLSRGDLWTRKRHAGPALPTPDAQCHGTHTFEYALAFSDNASDAELVRMSADYRYGLIGGPPGFPTVAPVRITGSGFAFAAMKGSEDGDGVILRAYNPGLDRTSMELAGVEAAPVSLDESPLDKDAGLGPGRIASYRLRRQAE